MSTTFFVTRHPGAVEWARRKGIEVDEMLAHLDLERVQKGDTVIGVLPVHLAAEVCHKGARYLHLSLDIAAGFRGKELNADDMERFGARLEAFSVVREPG